MKKTVTLDQDVFGGAYRAGETITYDARIPTSDDGVGFVLSQFTMLEPRWYAAKYPGIEFAELVDVNTEGGEAMDEVAWRMYDGVTMGKFIGANADDLPRVAMSAKLFKAPIGYAGNEFEYSLDEIRKASAAGLPLDSTLASFARRGAEEHTQRVVYFGDAERGMTGLFNNQNVPTSNSTLDWFDPATTPLDIVNDVNEAINEVYNNTKGVSFPNRIVLSANRWTFIANTYASAQYPDKSILDLIREKNVYKAKTGRDLEIFSRFQLEQEELAKEIPGYTGGDIMLVYEKTPENLETHIPMPWRPIAPQPRGLKVVVPCEYKASGVQWRYPLSAVYRTMIKRT